MEGMDRFFSLVHLLPVKMTNVPLLLSPQLSCEAPSSWCLPSKLVVIQITQRLRPSNRDCACLRLSQGFRWDLTRHGLSSLPYWPHAVGGQVGKGVLRGGENHWVWIFFVASKCLSRQLSTALFPLKTYTVQQYCSRDCFRCVLFYYFQNEFTANSVGGLSC